MKYVSLFAGIGGFDLALNRLGHECVYANDIDKYCKLTYDKNFREVSDGDGESTQGNGETNQTKQGMEAEGQNIRSIGNSPNDNGARATGEIPCYDYKKKGLDTRDIRTVNISEIPDHDLLCGGFPCQSFSIAGKRGGFQDTRGTLFFEIARIADAKRPTYLLLENVKGLLSHDNGRTFETIMRTLDELRYDLQWQVLNSKNFGVPQNRERVFIVGHLRGTSKPKVFPLTRNNGENIQTDKIREIYEPFPETHRLSDAFRVRGTDGVSATLKGLGGGMGAKTGLYAVPETSYAIDANYYKGINTGSQGGRSSFEKMKRQVVGVIDTQNETVKDEVGTLQARSKDNDGCGFQIITGTPKYKDGKREVGYMASEIVPTIRATQYKSGDNQPLVLQEHSETEPNKTGILMYPHGTNPGGVKKLPNLRAHSGSIHNELLLQGDNVEIGTNKIQEPVVAKKDNRIMLTERRTDDAKAIRREMMKQGKDWSPRRGKELVPRNDDKANTVTSGPSKENLLADGMKIRRLTPVECERLQGFYDNFTAGVSDTQRYKQLGNAVTVNVVLEVARRLPEPVNT